MPTADISAIPADAPPATAQLSSQAGATSEPTVTPTMEPTTEPTAEPEGVSAWWNEISINTYGYDAALFTDATLPYPQLDRTLVTPPEMRVYRVLHLANSVIELTFMPELGGRLYQIRFLPTGQELLYNNTVIKPSYWGPVEQGWWLAAGGIEWCLPVEEHGYLSAEPWEASLSMADDGSATVTLHTTEKTRNIQVTVQVHLRPGSSAVQVRSTLYNPNAETKSLQYWINAMLSPGADSVSDGLRFVVPSSSVLMHSSGDADLPAAGAVMPWPFYDGRDLSYYSNWQNWLGFFGYNVEAPFTAVYDEFTQIGMVRAYPADIAPGVKFFGPGSEFPEVSAYTDDGSKYVEMWGGLTPTFWDYTELAPGASVSWEETWWVTAGGGTPVAANAELALAAQREGDTLAIGLMATDPGAWRIRISSDSEQLVDQIVQVSPQAAYRERYPLAASLGGRELLIEVLDANDQVVLSYTLT